MRIILQTGLNNKTGENVDNKPDLIGGISIEGFLSFTLNIPVIL